MKLSGSEQEKIRDALLDAFPRKSSLEQMLLYKLNKNLDAIAGGDNLKVIVYNLITTAVAEGWLEKLLKAARKENPGNTELQAVAEEFLPNDYEKKVFVFKREAQKVLPVEVISIVLGGCFLLVTGVGGYAYWQSQNSQKGLSTDSQTTSILSSNNQTPSLPITSTQPPSLNIQQTPISSPKTQQTPISSPNIQPTSVPNSSIQPTPILSTNTQPSFIAGSNTQSTPILSPDIRPTPVSSPNVQITPNSTQNKDELKSDRKVDYTNLQQLLAQGNWSQADKETQQVMLQAIGLQVGDSISYKKVLSFPCTDLRTIDNLWKKYSNGQFGFSVQKEIYLSGGGKVSKDYDAQAWKIFGDRTGWRVGGKWIERGSLDGIDFTNSAPQGHLPYQAHLTLGARRLKDLGFFPRIYSCNL